MITLFDFSRDFGQDFRDKMIYADIVAKYTKSDLFFFTEFVTSQLALYLIPWLENKHPLVAV